MAPSKLTARKSTGGKAPRKQLAAMTARSTATHEWQLSVFAKVRRRVTERLNAPKAAVPIKKAESAESSTMPLSSLTESTARALLDKLSLDKIAGSRITPLLNALCEEVAEVRAEQLHARIPAAHDQWDSDEVDESESDSDELAESKEPAPSTCFDAVDRVKDLPDQIRRYMRDFPGEERYAWKLCFDMMMSSHVDHEHTTACGWHDAGAADNLCAEVAMMRKDVGGKWSIRRELDALESAASYLNLSTVAFFPETRQLLALYAGGVEEVRMVIDEPNEDSEQSEGMN